MTFLVTQLHRQLHAGFAYCFNIESSQELKPNEMERLRLILADGFLIDTVTLEPSLTW